MIEWSKRASKVDDNLFGIGILTTTYKSKCGRNKVVMHKDPGRSERWTPYSLVPNVPGHFALHRDPTKSHRTRSAAEKVCLQHYLKGRDVCTKKRKQAKKRKPA